MFKLVINYCKRFKMWGRYRIINKILKKAAVLRPEEVIGFSGNKINDYEKNI